LESKNKGLKRCSKTNLKKIKPMAVSIGRISIDHKDLWLKQIDF
jgi:hypothetical protein